MSVSRLAVVLLAGFSTIGSGLAVAQPAKVTPEVARILEYQHQFLPTAVFAGFARSGEVIVKPSRESAEQIGIFSNQPLPAEQLHPANRTSILLGIKPGFNAASIIEQIRAISPNPAHVSIKADAQEDFIVYDEPNGILLDTIDKLAHVAGVSGLEINRPFGSPSGSSSTTCQANTALAQIHAPKWKKVGCPKKCIVVAVLDTGVDYNHAQLKGQVIKNTDKEYQKDVTDDASGGTLAPHGTRCAGIIAATPGAADAVRGLAGNAKILAVKMFYNADQYCYTDMMVSAIKYATKNKARIINISAGTDPGLSEDFSIELPQAIQEAATQNNAIIVAAAGNDLMDMDDVNKRVYPACYNMPNVVCVMSRDDSDSNHGTGFVDIAAPGHDIKSTIPGGGQNCDSGTSFAAPYVSGALALIWGQKQYKNASYSVVMNALFTRYATQSGTLHDKCSGSQNLELDLSQLPH